MMIVALDKNGNRIFADAGIRHTDCFCQVCREPLTHKMGNKKAHHFAHKPESACPYGKENKGEWHIYMQSLFSKEAIEKRFPDDGKVEHIADVYLKEDNTVIEFQDSRIEEDKFKERTTYYLSRGIRLVWVFNEVGRLKQSYFNHFCYSQLYYKWIRARRMISSVCNDTILQHDNYCICVYYGEENTVRRVVRQEENYRYLQFSLNKIRISGAMDVDVFFQNEYSFSPWKEINAERRRKGIYVESPIMHLTPPCP